MRGSIHSGLHSGRGSSGPTGPMRGRCPRTVRQGLRQFAGHQSSTSLGYGNNQIRTLIGGLYPTASSLNQQNMMMQGLHSRHFPHLTSADNSSRIGFNRDPSTPPNSPMRPGPRIRQRVASWEMQPLGNTKRFSGMYVPEREPDKIESPRSHRFPGSRRSTPQSPVPAPRPNPAT